MRILEQNCDRLKLQHQPISSWLLGSIILLATIASVIQVFVSKLRNFLNPLTLKLETLTHSESLISLLILLPFIVCIVGYWVRLAASLLYKSKITCTFSKSAQKLVVKQQATFFLKEQEFEYSLSEIQRVTVEEISNRYGRSSYVIKLCLESAELRLIHSSNYAQIAKSVNAIRSFISSN